MIRKLAFAAALAALGLCACDNASRGGVNGICKPFAAQTANSQPTPAPTAIPRSNAEVLPAAPAGDPAANLDDCLHRWGYTLAASPDPANFAAEATVAACTTALSAWNQQGLSAENAGGAVQAPSLLTGQQTNPLAEHYAFAQGRALFYVVQARAGHCAPPQANANKTG
jgi:hypothetical protein